MTEDLTPPSGGEKPPGEEQLPASDDMQAMEQRLADLEAEKVVLTEGIGKRDRLISQTQGRADRLATKLQVMTQQRSKRPPTSRGTRRQQAADQGSDRDEELAEAQAESYISSMESMKLRLLAQHGLSESEMPEGLNLSDISPGELRLHIELAATNKNLRELGASPASQHEPGPEGEEQPEGEGASPVGARGAGGLFDTGGPTGVEAQERLDRIDALHAKSEKLRDEGSRKQGAYLKLRTIHQDPRKIVRTPQQEDELDILERG